MIPDKIEELIVLASLHGNKVSSSSFNIIYDAMDNRCIYIYDKSDDFREVMCITYGGEIIYFSHDYGDTWWDADSIYDPDFSGVIKLKYVGDFLGWKYMKHPTT